MVPIGEVSACTLAEILGHKISSLRMIYLGLPLGLDIVQSHMGSNYRDDGMEVSRLEEVIFLTRWQNHFE